jgi:multimeric flavodoxin WrbA
MEMKVVAFNGSPRKEGNTWQALKMVAAELEAAGIETEIVTVGDKPIRGCIACGMCAKNRNEQCVLPGDEVNAWIQLMKQADGVLLGLHPDAPSETASPPTENRCLSGGSRRDSAHFPGRR